MAPSRKILIPRIFNYLLPLQGIVAAVAIYSSIYVFGVGTVPFILNVVAAGIHFLLGFYFCITQARPGIHHAYIVPPWLVCGAGVWCGALYYFTKLLEVIVVLNTSTRYPQPHQSLTPTWTKVGCAMTGFNVLLDLTLLGWFILSVLKQRSKSNTNTHSNSFISTPVYPITQQQQQHHHQFHQFQSRPQQLLQQQQPPNPYVQQHARQPSTSPADFKSLHPVSPLSPISPSITLPKYDPQNRISVIRRLSALQHPDGHWDYTPELASLVKLWGGRELMSPAHGVTALTHACMTDLCNYVWTAQREGREHERLSTAELISLEEINWDLGWARLAIERAEGWVAGYR
ncbi:hypothetical protein QBC43DRAFT_314777 [Cladorrhinum sp. PSN259]|nr:hypothetical protein QBC43DRAFT_314777 [Cladorrhinum sp. PSN259]